MAYARSGTLAPGVVTAVDVVADGNGLQIVNRSGSGAIWVRLDGVDPVAAANDTFVVLGVRHFPTRTGPVNVRMISAAALDWTVEGVVRS